MRIAGGAGAALNVCVVLSAHCRSETIRISPAGALPADGRFA